MNSQRTLDVSRLPDLGLSTRAPLFWGAMAVVMIEGTMFALCIAAYYYARLSVDVWPPPGVQFPQMALVTIGLVLLILSCYPAYLASEAAKRNDVPKVRLYLAANLLLATAAVVLRVVQWHNLNFNWKSDIHGSLVWAILGLHTFDLVTDMLLTAVLICYTFAGWNDTHRQGVDFDSFTWYFLVGIWIPLYLTVFIAPHVVRT